MNSLQQVIKFS